MLVSGSSWTLQESWGLSLGWGPYRSHGASVWGGDRTGVAKPLPEVI